MKKLFTVLSVLFVLGTANVFATGLGAQFGGNVTEGGNFGTGAAITFKLDKVPCVFAADLAFGSNYFAGGLTADWWLANPKIEGTWGYYYGIGVGGSVGFANSNYAGLSIGPRALIGTNIFLLDRVLEFYLQGAWQPTINIAAGDGANVNFSWVNFPVALGFRFWF